MYIYIYIYISSFLPETFRIPRTRRHHSKWIFLPAENVWFKKENSFSKVESCSKRNYEKSGYCIYQSTPVGKNSERLRMYLCTFVHVLFFSENAKENYCSSFG